MRSSIGIGLVLAACGGAPPPSTAPEHAGAVATEAQGDPPPLPSDRAMPTDATFGDLVTAAVHQDDRRASDSEAGCLLRTTANGFVLEADLSVAVRGLTDTASDLDARVETSGGRARVLTRLGSYGGTGQLVAGQLVAVALTTIAGTSHRTGVLLVQTSAGVYVLGTDAAGGDHPVEIAAALAMLAAMDPASLFVTANASVSLADFSRLLAALPASLEGRVAIAAILPEDARAPDESETASRPEAVICADGLPPLADDAQVGDVATSVLHTSLYSLVPSAQACVATSASGLGGLVRVAFRISDDGHVRQACVREDATGDATLRGCLVDALQALTFPAPRGGAVDVELPLRLELIHDAAHHQRPICE